MTILFLTDGLFPLQVGGMQRHSSVLITYLLSRGHQIIALHPGGKHTDKKNISEFFGANSHLSLVEVPFPAFARFPGHYVRENRAYSKRCYQAISGRLDEIDVIYAQGFTAHYFFKRRKFIPARIPIFLNLHGFEMFQPQSGWRSYIGNLFLRNEALFNLAKADYIYSFGGKLDKVLTELNIPQSKIVYQSNAVPDHWIIQKKENLHYPRTFVFIGRNERRKGLPELMNALNQIKAEFKIHFVGPVEEQARQKDSRFFYHGEIRDSSQIQSILDQCDCLILPSYSEGMPTVILEAMARGLAILATHVGAVSRMIDGNGILIDHPEVSLLAEGITKMLDLSEEDLFAMKMRSIELVKQNFTWSVVADRKIQDFERALNS